MLRDITIGQHFPGNSLVHRFDPRLKLVLTIAYIVLLFAASNPLGLTLSILFLGVMYKVAKIPVKMIGKSLKPILPIVLFTAVLNLFFVSGEGDPLVHFWFLSIYAEGVRYAVLMAVRVMALIAGTSLLTYTTSPIVLTDAIEQLLKPLGKLHFPVHELAMMRSIALLCRHPCLPAGVPELLKINSLALSVIASQCHIPPFVAARHLPPAGGSLSSKGEALAVHANFPVLPRALPLGELSRQQALTERASPAE